MKYFNEDVEPHVFKHRNHDSGMSNIGITYMCETVDKDSQDGFTAVDSVDEAIISLKTVNLNVPNGPNEDEDVIIEGAKLTPSQPRRFWQGRELDIDITKPSDLHTQASAST